MSRAAAANRQFTAAASLFVSAPGTHASCVPTRRQRPTPETDCKQKRPLWQRSRRCV